jgi:hypothetical protein
MLVKKRAHAAQIYTNGLGVVALRVMDSQPYGYSFAFYVMVTKPYKRFLPNGGGNAAIQSGVGVGLPV